MSSHDDAGVRQTGRDVGHTVRIVVIVALVVAIVAIAADNREQTKFGYVIGDADVAVWLLVLAAAVGGIVIGWLVRHRPRRN